VLTDPISALKASTGWIEVETVTEAEVVLTFKGYAPVLQVRVLKSGLVKYLYISPKSLATVLEEMRRSNGNKFVGLKFRFRKESEDKASQYIVEKIE